MESTRRRSINSLYFRMLIPVVLLLQSCASTSRFIDHSPGGCQPGGECILEGVIAARSHWDVSIEKPDGCIALALPRSFAEVAPKFDGKIGRIAGEGYVQPAVTPGRVSFHYEVDGLRVNRNFCDGVAVVVDSIVLRNGRVWSRSSSQAPF